MATSVKDVCRLTEDLEREMLVRLPVKSLLRFKCACKTWYTLINTPSFTREHLGNKRRSQLLIYDHSANVDNSIPIMTIINPPLVAKFDHDLQGQGFGNLSTLIGSVDGLFLLQKGYVGNLRFALWNPATREVRPLPAVNDVVDSIRFTYNVMIGFGLDPFNSNNYKVVWFHIAEYLCQGDKGGIRTNGAVYSCSSDSWRILEPISNKIINREIDFFKYDTGSAYLNGAYYWLFKKGRKMSILTFDFGSEVFGEIYGPDITSYSYLDITKLILVDDHSTIAILKSNADRSVYDIWVPSPERGVWNKLVTFQCPYHIFDCRWDSSTLVFLTEEEKSGGGFLLVSYDVRTQETRHLGYRHPGKRSSCRFSYYKESLVTIKRRGRIMYKGWDIEQEQLK